MLTWVNLNCIHSVWLDLNAVNLDDGEVVIVDREYETISV